MQEGVKEDEKENSSDDEDYWNDRLQNKKTEKEESSSSEEDFWAKNQPKPQISMGKHFTPTPLQPVNNVKMKSEDIANMNKN